MSFAQPSSLALLALAVPVGLLYLVRVRRRELTVGTDQFWEQVFAERHFRSAWRRLRDVGSLLVQLALLALLALAAAEPLWSSQVVAPRRVVLVIDDSASMAATDGHPNRLEDARRAASGVVAGLREVDLAALVVAGTEPRVARGFTNDRRALDRDLASLQPAETPTRVGDAVTLARRLLAEHANGRIEVFSDGCFSGAVELARAKDIAFHRVGRRTGNVGITRFQARRSLRDPTGYQILIEARNFSDGSVTCRLDVERDGSPVDALPMALGPGETFQRVLDKTSIEGGRLRAHVDRDDALACDNHAWAILPSRQPLPVTLVAEGDHFANLYVEKVLEANPLVRRPVPVITVAEAELAGPADEIRVYHERVPARLPPGRAFVVAPGDSCDLWDSGPPYEPSPALVVTPDRTSPLLAFVKLESVELARVIPLKFKSKPTVLASLDSGEPLLALLDRPRGNVAVLTASIEDPTDLPLRTAFPIIVGNVLSWLDAGQSDLHESYRAGGSVELAVSGPDLQLWSPDGQLRPCTTANNRLTAGPLDRCGAWRVAARADGPIAAEFVCNLTNPEESDLRPPRELAPARAPSFAGVRLRPPWFLLTFAACAMLVVEWRLFQRRWLC